MRRLDELYQEAFGWDRLKLDAVHLAIGCYVCPRLPGKPSPAWGVLLGPPSCGKSTILGMFDGFPFTVAVDHLTRNALTSCYHDDDSPEEDHSFLHQLAYSRAPEGVKVWIIQELSSIVSSDPVILEKQLADLRAAHVGKHASHGGMGGTKTREIGQFGMVVGTTESFESFRSRMSTFGDRFITIRMSRPERGPDALINDAMAAWSSDRNRKASLLGEIQAETHRLLRQFVETSQYPSVEPIETHKLVDWSVLHSTFSSVPLSGGMPVTAAARPFRIIEQVRSFGDAHSILCGRTSWTEDEIRIARRIFQDSMPRSNFDALKALWPNGCAPAPNHSHLYSQWSALGAVQTERGGSVRYGSSETVQLTDRFRTIVERSGYLAPFSDTGDDSDEN